MRVLATDSEPFAVARKVNAACWKFKVRENMVAVPDRGIPNSDSAICSCCSHDALGWVPFDAENSRWMCLVMHDTMPARVETVRSCRSLGVRVRGMWRTKEANRATAHGKQ